MERIKQGIEIATKTDAGEVLTRIANLQGDVNDLKEHLEDITLSPEDISLIEENEKLILVSDIDKISKIY